MLSLKRMAQEGERVTNNFNAGYMNVSFIQMKMAILSLLKQNGTTICKAAIVREQHQQLLLTGHHWDQVAGHILPHGIPEPEDCLLWPLMQ